MQYSRSQVCMPIPQECQPCILLNDSVTKFESYQRVSFQAGLWCSYKRLVQLNRLQFCHFLKRLHFILPTSSKLNHDVKNVRSHISCPGSIKNLWKATTVSHLHDLNSNIVDGIFIHYFSLQLQIHWQIQVDG